MVWVLVLATIYQMMMMMLEVMGCMVRKKRGGGWIVKSCPASFAGQLLHCSNTLAGSDTLLVILWLVRCPQNTVVIL